MRHSRRESIHAALALLLGPETEYHARVRATRKIVRQGPAVLPLVLSTLSHYPEITEPAWPWWPPQYEHCSRLLLHLSHLTHVRLADMVQPPTINEPAGPVLWISVIEAAGFQPHEDYEQLLCQGLAVSWTTVRYAAAMALATRATKVSLHRSTLEILHAHQDENEAFPVRLTASHALMSSGEPIGLQVLLEFLEPHIPIDVRKASAFLLATELPAQLSVSQRELATARFLHALNDPDHELASYAAHALSKVASPHILPTLCTLLEEAPIHTQVIILTILEELARRKSIRRALRHLTLPTQILPFLTSAIPELRRQAFYTLAACGGEYVAAVLGTIVLNKEHIGHIEAIESLRLLHGVLRTSFRDNVVRWLLGILPSSPEEIQMTSLDSLAYLLWQARIRGQERAWRDISLAVINDGYVVTLLKDKNARVRQHAVEALMMLNKYRDTIDGLPAELEMLLRTDKDSGVRASIAYACGLMGARWAIPALIHTLLDEDEHVVYTALGALGQVATADDPIVVYVLLELTHGQYSSDPTAHALGREAQMILQNWQDAEQGEVTKKLHSFRSVL